MSTKDAHLYRPATNSTSKPKIKTTTNPISTTFSSTFSSLLASTSSNGPPKSRPSFTKDGLAPNSNRGTKKRALADMLGTTRKPSNSSSADKLDEGDWRRAKRKMDEKALLYSALKRGDIDDRDERYGVDFDRKWAERDAKGDVSAESESDEGIDSGDDERIEYVDDMGRTRMGSRKEVQVQQRREARRRRAEDAEDEDRARPVAPTGVIYGDAIQHQAFDLDADAGAQMAHLAGKRDKEETPPPDEHYDASKEVRTKGSGFYQFSQDKEMREEQMRGLEEMRQETEKVRGERVSEREREKEKKRQMLEERRRVIAEKKGKVMADRFLNGLGDEIAASGRGLEGE